MLFIKVLNGNGDIVSVEALEEPVYIMQIPSNGVVVICKKASEAQGIQDVTGSYVYQLYGKTPIQDESITRIAHIIPEYEYDELTAEYPEPNPQPEEPQEEETPPLTMSQMREVIETQQATIEELQQTNDMLLECLLEISEIVYA